MVDPAISEAQFARWTQGYDLGFGRKGIGSVDDPNGSTSASFQRVFHFPSLSFSIFAVPIFISGQIAALTLSNVGLMVQSMQIPLGVLRRNVPFFSWSVRSVAQFAPIEKSIS